MSETIEPNALVDLIYEAALESELWPTALILLSSAMGTTRAAMSTLDRRANVFSAIAPGLDPALLASYKDHWAFHDPVLARAMARPAGEIYTLDSLMPREEFAATPVFNEFWRPAGYSLESLGANLLVEEQFLALIGFSNGPGKESVTAKQIQFFETVLPHLIRAVRINRRLWDLELKEAAERLQNLPQGALLADASARVICANATGKAMLDDGHTIFLDNGRLSVAGASEILQNAIASCARTSPPFRGPGREFEIPQQTPRAPIFVTVTPLRSKARLADIPWTSHGAPVAIVTARDPDMDRRQQAATMRRHFGLTPAELELAVEILKGNGRIAAARRCRISSETAKTRLSSIFRKTGTHRQAELVRVLLASAETRETGTKNGASDRFVGVLP